MSKWLKIVSILAILVFLSPSESQNNYAAYLHQDDKSILESFDVRTQVKYLKEELKKIEKEKLELEESYCSLKEDYEKSENFQIFPWVDFELHPKMLHALDNYLGPFLAINSGKRNKSIHKIFFKNFKGSKHRSGEAFDTTLNEKTLKWLESAEGQKWCENFDLRYFVEFKSESKQYRYYSKNFKNVVINKNATGPHIHIELKSRSRYAFL